MEITTIYENALQEIAYLSEPNSDIAEIASSVLEATGAFAEKDDSQLDLFD